MRSEFDSARPQNGSLSLEAAYPLQKQHRPTPNRNEEHLQFRTFGSSKDKLEEGVWDRCLFMMSLALSQETHPIIDVFAADFPEAFTWAIV